MCSALYLHWSFSSFFSCHPGLTGVFQQRSAIPCGPVTPSTALCESSGRPYSCLCKHPDRLPCPSVDRARRYSGLGALVMTPLLAKRGTVDASGRHPRPSPLSCHEAASSAVLQLPLGPGRCRLSPAAVRGGGMMRPLWLSGPGRLAATTSANIAPAGHSATICRRLQPRRRGPPAIRLLLLLPRLRRRRRRRRRR